MFLKEDQQKGVNINMKTILINITWIVALTLLLLGLQACHTEADEEGTDVLTYQGINYYDEGSKSYDKAIESFEKILKNEPDNYQAQIFIAFTYSAMGGVDIFDLARKMIGMVMGSSSSSDSDKKSSSSDSKKSDGKSDDESKEDSSKKLWLVTPDKAQLVGSAKSKSKSKKSSGPTGLTALTSAIDPLSTKQKEYVKQKEYTTMEDLGKDFPELASLQSSLDQLDKLPKDYEKARVNLIKGFNLLIRSLKFFVMFFDQDGDGTIDSVSILDELEKKKEQGSSGFTDSSTVNDVVKGINSLSAELDKFVNSKVLDWFSDDLENSMQAFKDAGAPDSITDSISEMAATLTEYRKKASDALGGRESGGGKFIQEQLGEAVQQKVDTIYEGETVPEDITSAITELKSSSSAEDLSKAAEDAGVDGEELTDEQKEKLEAAKNSYRSRLTVEQVFSLISLPRPVL